MLFDEYLHGHANQIYRATQHYLEELHRYLFGPIAEGLRTPHLTIVPHGLLHLLPFHAFAHRDRYVIDDFEVSYAPSASVLKYCLDKNTVEDAQPCVIGVSDETTPFVEQEVQNLNAMFPGSTVLFNDDATRAAFAEKVRRASFVHIATHGLFRQDNPMFSRFKLSDGWVTALDLFGMTCETNLVTLSGCKSGMTQITGSDDLLGLMRGFLYAGSRSLMLSLWNVDDRSTAQLMTAFYQAWRGGDSKAKALGEAMKTVRKEYKNPFHWAPFKLIGKA
jgi:CHAT domain-containing protein